MRTSRNGKLCFASARARKCAAGAHFICYGDEENARIYAVHLTTANQSEIRRAHLVSVTHEPKLWELRQIAAVDNLHKDLRMQDQIAEKVQVRSKKVIHIRKNDFKAKSDL